ncbi:energy transducer TonB [Mucilaginibacter sp. SP1R1]|uniref:energy transducer TonB n=1 Tax=Mucilaginibacter sp. SP1R1 TaxID=2723091 RepID=UPI00161A6BD6|nr:energy transducer TonB [Mucilaginibacter sp. SP1R1]MBB6152497.1 TonB family protein [Mucilaginibacter sp. SP1R1]
MKNNGKHVDLRDSADFIRIVREPDSASAFYNVFEFYPNGTNKLIGKSSFIDPLRLEEQCITYYKNGHKQKTCTYKNGQLINNEYDYYPNGKLYQAKQFPADGKYYNELENNFLLTECLDSLGTKLVTNGNGHYVGYDDDFKKTTKEGDIKNGKRDGLWKGRFDEVHTRFEENYANGVLISGTATLDGGKINTYTKARMIAPEFKGGIEAFGRYLSRKIEYPYTARRDNIEGRVVLSFVVEKNGQVTEIKVQTAVNPELDNEAIRVLKESPIWVPGKRFGVPVRVIYSVPINFALNGN